MIRASGRRIPRDRVRARKGLHIPIEGGTVREGERDEVGRADS